MKRTLTCFTLASEFGSNGNSSSVCKLSQRPSVAAMTTSPDCSCSSYSDASSGLSVSSVKSGQDANWYGQSKKCCSGLLWNISCPFRNRANPLSPCNTPPCVDATVYNLEGAGHRGCCLEQTLLSIKLWMNGVIQQITIKLLYALESIPNDAVHGISHSLQACANG